MDGWICSVCGSEDVAMLFDCERCGSSICRDCAVFGTARFWVCKDCATEEDVEAHEDRHHYHQWANTGGSAYERCISPGCGAVRPLLSRRRRSDFV